MKNDKLLETLADFIYNEFNEIHELGKKSKYKTYPIFKTDKQGTIKIKNELKK